MLKFHTTCQAVWSQYEYKRSKRTKLSTVKIDTTDFKFYSCAMNHTSNITLPAITITFVKPSFGNDLLYFVLSVYLWQQYFPPAVELSMPLLYVSFSSTKPSSKLWKALKTSRFLYCKIKFVIKFLRHNLSFFLHISISYILETFGANWQFWRTLRLSETFLTFMLVKICSEYFQLKIFWIDHFYSQFQTFSVSSAAEKTCELNYYLRLSPWIVDMTKTKNYLTSR